MSNKIENPSLEITGSESCEMICAGFNKDGKRFHVWLTKEGELERKYNGSAVLYCNPPRGTDKYSPEHFKTRRLDADNKANAPLIKQLMESIDFPGEWAKHKARQEDERLQAERDRKERELNKEIEERATSMLSILAAIRTQANGDLSDTEFRGYTRDVLMPEWLHELINKSESFRAAGKPSI